MQAVFVFGRMLFVLLFVFAGAQKLLDIAGTASMIASKLTIPPTLSGPATAVEAALGMSTPQLLAILAGATELVAGILVGFNIGIRAAITVLILFTAIGSFYMNDFWNMTGEPRANNIIQAMQNISLIGALLMLMVLGSSRPGESESKSDI